MATGPGLQCVGELDVHKRQGVASRCTQADRMEAITKQHKSIHDIIIWCPHLIACPNENLCMLPHSHFVNTMQVNKQA